MRENTILIVDNRPVGDTNDRIARITEIVARYPTNPRTEVLHHKELRMSDVLDARAVILSGSAFNISELEKEASRIHRESHGGRDFETEMRVVLETPRPVLAICFGHALAALAFGGVVNRNDMSSEWNTAMSITVRPGDGVLKGEYTVDVNHKDHVSPDDRQLRNHFEIWAISTDAEQENLQYVQCMRHRKLPLYCVQFHPETHKSKPLDYKEGGEATFENARRDGERIIHSFLEPALAE